MIALSFPGIPAHWRLSIASHGHESQPVVVIDGFVREPEDWVEDAALLSFRAMGEHYPGVRAMVPRATLAPLLDALAPVARGVFGLTALAVVDAFYSIVTTPPAALAPIQRMPHVDEVSPTRLALLHYLSRDDRGGTAFFRHRATGYETIDAARLDPYRVALAADVATHGLPAPGFIDGDTTLFEEVARHRGVFNRAILYRSNSLHCAAIPPDTVFTADPMAGRLTVNTFLEGAACGAPATV
ncbi:hypothetical protein ASG29_00905 [Sphingomonas sp. Leaf412]|uniref:DUF6445 family protein n=1 Tax=Sphingomonas sp. Leaf412 TaxID=1736370 RepID=UPI0006F893B8|nr:DUF6445 family protein [Sphingomonas sp. Leaf412]KQT34753.1 hypothetical protein ASG29_00905 [Sphingomonas sp. Leaf412]